MLEITSKGHQRMLELQTKARDLDEEREKLQTAEGTYPLRRTKQIERFQSAWRRVSPYLSILWELDVRGPLPREYFYWHREQPLQEGYIRVHDRARNKVIDELVARGYVIET